MSVVLADHTNGRIYATVLRPSVVCLSSVTYVMWLNGESVALLSSRTNNRNVAGSRPTKVVCITVLTGNRLG